jgi:GGDEF domain-containing protein
MQVSSSYMNTVAVGFWGAFFGSVAMMLAGSLLAYARSMHKVALRAALTALLSALFVISYVGWLPIEDPENERRVLAHIAAGCSAILGLMLLTLMGVARRADGGLRLRAAIVAVAALVVVVGWALPAGQALALGSVLALVVGITALVVCIRSVRRGDRLAWLAVSAVFVMLLAIAGLSTIALGQVESWPLHAMSALAGMAYLCIISAALWARYSHLIELREVMAHGPSYDPVTRMRSHAETGQMVGAAFNDADGQHRPVGVIAISIGNLYALEQLHGRGAVNHALFICASRLRRCVPTDVEMGRLGEDGFLLLTRNSPEPARLVAIARQVAQRLAHPVSLNIAYGPPAGEESRASWVADVGVGVLAAAAPAMRPSAAVGMARAMSRTAWSFGSRIAWFNRDRREIAELPLADAP